jgi:anaphase-promoting complex subunit 1
MIQRVLDQPEIDEAESTGDIPLPTIFSITTPYSEASAVGLTAGILRDSGKASPSLVDEDENASKPLKSVPATEMVIWASSRTSNEDDDVLVTVDPEQRQLSVWRYAYVKPRDIPIPLGSSKTRTTTEIPERPPLAALPGMPPSLSTTTTMASLLPGASQLSPLSNRVRRNSLTRNDLSVTMDRMALGGKVEMNTTLVPIEHGQMKAAYWMEKLYSQEISDSE